MNENQIIELYKNNQFLEALKNLKSIKNKSFKLYNLEGMIFFKLGDLKKSTSLFQKSISLNRNFIDPRVNLGLIYVKNNEIDMAYETFLSANKIDQNNAIVNFYIGKIIITKFNDLSKAEGFFLKAILSSDKNVQYLNELALLYFNKSRYNDAIFFFRKSIDIKYQKDLLFLLSKSYTSLNKIDDSLFYLDKILLKEPLNVEALYLKSMNYLYLGRKNDAENILEKIVSLQPSHAKSYFELSRLSGSFFENNIDYIIKNYQNSNHSYEKAEYAFSLFNYFDKKNDTDQASKYLIEANKNILINRNANPFNDKMEFSIYKNIFSNKLIKNSKLDEVANKIPIFIVGMPRSGSSLIEHILSYYENIENLGEVDYFYRSVEYVLKDMRLENLEKAILENFENNKIKNISKYYLKLVNTDKIFFTDKMLSNFRFVGLIIKLFPKAKIIFCKREKNENCFSIYSNHFGSILLPWRYNQKLINEQYDIHLDLMNFWKDSFKDNIIEVHHDEMINNPSFVTKKVINFIGLKWDSKCLQLNSNKSLIKTASVNQIREGIYSQKNKKHLKYKNYFPLLFT